MRTEHVVYANLAARHLLNEGRSLQRPALRRCLTQRAGGAARAPPRSQADSLFSSEIDGVEETFHLSQRAFILQGRALPLVPAQAL